MWIAAEVIARRFWKSVTCVSSPRSAPPRDCTASRAPPSSSGAASLSPNVTTSAACLASLFSGASKRNQIPTSAQSRRTKPRSVSRYCTQYARGAYSARVSKRCATPAASSTAARISGTVEPSKTRLVRRCLSRASRGTSRTRKARRPTSIPAHDSTEATTPSTSRGVSASGAIVSLAGWPIAASASKLGSAVVNVTSHA
jgi:hypothetical protein